MTHAKLSECALRATEERRISLKFEIDEQIRRLEEECLRSGFGELINTLWLYRRGEGEEGMEDRLCRLLPDVAAQLSRIARLFEALQIEGRTAERLTEQRDKAFKV